MRTIEFITESLSRVAYHYTGIHAAYKILSSGKFELSSAYGSIEQQYAPKGYPYFLSCTRTRHGGYHDIVGSHGVLFVLDGNWFNQHYPAKPVDYWLNRNPQGGSHRAHEAEDRVFSRESTIPIDGVTAIHVYVDSEAEPQIKALARKTLIAAKRLGIKTHLYDDKDAWRNFDPRAEKHGDIGGLTGQERTGGYVSTHPGYLLPWIELLMAKSPDHLGKRAKEILYSLQYPGFYYKQDVIRGLENEFSNARKPNSGPDRQHAVKIINFMNKHRLNTISELVDYLTDKWKNIE